MQNPSASVVSGQHFLFFSTFGCPFRLGQRHICKWRFSWIVDIITTTTLYTEWSIKLLWCILIRAADILAPLLRHSIEFPAYHYYAATSYSPAHENFTVAIFSARDRDHAAAAPRWCWWVLGKNIWENSWVFSGSTPHTHWALEQCVASPCDMAVTNSNKQTKL